MKSNSVLYYVEIDWFDDYSDENRKSKCFAFASSLANLGQRISDTFKYINKITIEEVNNMCDFELFWVDSDEVTNKMIDVFKDANKY